MTPKLCLQVIECKNHPEVKVFAIEDETGCGVRFGRRCCGNWIVKHEWEFTDAEELDELEEAIQLLREKTS